MPATVLVAIVVALSGWVTTGIALYAQARRDNTTYERSQREAKSQRVRSAYRLALNGVNIILVAAVEASNPLATGDTLDKREERLERDYSTGADMVNQAGTELILENVSNNVPDLSIDILRGYDQVRLKIAEAHPDGSPTPPEELQQIAASLVQSTQQLREAIRAHMAELEPPPMHRSSRFHLSIPVLRRPRADAPRRDP